MDEDIDFDFSQFDEDLARLRAARAKNIESAKAEYTVERMADVTNRGKNRRRTRKANKRARAQRKASK